jgi:S-DNA-T family DNA segregation ATPase FtsK/SpoIIIE
VLRSFEGLDLPELELLQVLKKAPPRTVLLIDDAETLKDADAGTTLRQLIKSGSDSGRAIVAAGAGEDLAGGFSGWIPDMRRGRLGALLSPQSSNEADVLGVRVSRSVIGQPVVPGRALVHLGDGQVVTAQIPLTTPADAAPPSGGAVPPS